MYLAFALIPDKVASAHGEQLARALRAALTSLKRPPDVLSSGADVRAVFPGATFQVHPDDGAHVLEESADLASQPKIRAKASLADEVRACRRRIEVSGEDDPAMARFNDYLSLLQALEKAVPGILLLDPREGEVI